MKRCASCGSKVTGASFWHLGDYVPFCASCMTQARAGAGLNYYLPTKKDSSLPIEERFDELFKAARVLLGENAGESQVVPTLALASLLGQGVPRLAAEKERFAKLQAKETWDTEADGFARRYGGLRPVRLIQGTLILEKVPVVIGIDYDDHHENPEVAIYAYPHQTTLAKPEDVAFLYAKKMSESGISCDEERTANLNVRFLNDTLQIRLWPGTAPKRATITEGTTVPQLGWRIDKASFPHPRVVQAFYTGLRGEFVRALTIRRRGRQTEAENLVPACVVFFLRKYGIKGRKEPHRLLMKHVLDSSWKGTNILHTPSTLD